LRLTLTILLLGFLLGCGNRQPNEAYNATAAIYRGNNFVCSAVSIGWSAVITARHCVVSVDTNEITEHQSVTFAGNEEGPFYLTEIQAISLTDDLAILHLVNGAGLPRVQLGQDLDYGAAVFNVSYPLGVGKLRFDGESVAPEFSRLPAIFQMFPQWRLAAPVNITIAHGSSGSGVFESTKRTLVGIVVGTTGEGEFQIMEPASRVRYLLTHLQDNTKQRFQAANPVHEDETDDLF
jgi:hypothetical protein